MIEALKIIVIACQVSFTPGPNTSIRAKIDNDVLLSNSKVILKVKQYYQRECQQKLTACWLNNKSEGNLWPLSSCIGGVQII